MMMILGSQSGVVFELRLTGERSLQIITQDCRKADVNSGILCFNLNTKISSSQNWPKSSSDHLDEEKNEIVWIIFDETRIHILG